MFRCIVFDFDGTIVSSNDLKKEIFFKLLKPYRISKKLIISELIKEGNSRNEIFNNILINFPQNKIREIITKFSKICDDKISKLSPSDDFFKIVEYAKLNNINLIISSNTPEENLIRIVKSLGIHSFFTEINGYPKHKTDTLKKLITKYNISPKKVLVVGDGQSDMDSAENNNCNFYYVKNAELDINSVINYEDTLGDSSKVWQ